MYRLLKRNTNRVFLLLAGCAALHAQLSSSAYRVLGQMDFRQDGTNMVQGVELYSPSGVALDPRNGQIRLYIADTGNSRVLAWSDAGSYQMGDPPALVLGQPGPQYSNAFGIGTKGFNGLSGLAVDPLTGNLYVADTGDHRILRFASPLANPSRIEPDAVLGQPNFSTRAASANTNGLNQPRGLAFDSAGNLWVADTGNHRVLRFAAATLSSAAPPAADMVIGQKDFSTGVANAGGTISASGFDAPVALAFDAQNNLYVSDFNNARVMKFSAPLTPSNPNPAAGAVWGQSSFATRGVPQQANASTLAGPVGLSVDGSGNLYVAVPHDNRVLVFSLNAPAAAARIILGQTDPTTTTANTGTAPLASPNSVSAPADVKVDPTGNIFIADSGNHRVLDIPAGAKSATRVWGQSDFAANGPNQVKPGSINYPYKMAIDYSASPFALYVADTNNNRVLVWKDSVRFRSGDPADLVIGQPNLRIAAANVDSQGSSSPSRTSLAGPTGIAVNPYDGTLYVADFGNNRVLRYPRPVDQSGRIAPDAVIGQVDFTSSASALVNASSLNGPTGVAIGPNGDVFVADSGNNRVLEYAAGAGNGAPAIRVYGQPGMISSVKPSQVSAQTLASPQGIAVDQASNLYVADAGANRVLIFPNTQSAPVAGMPATFVLGPPGFGSTGSSLKSPSDVGVDSSGSIYVVDKGNNRVLMFQSLLFLPIYGATPSGVIGQQTTSGTSPNWNSPDGLATPESVYAPAGLYVDRQDTVYVGDAGNNRVLQFLKAASVVNAATFQAGVPVAQGALASLFGNGIATDKDTVSVTPWPKTLVNRQLVFNDEIEAPLYYVGPGQVNFQVPSSVPLGADRVAVRVADTGELVAGGSLLVSAASPGIFTSNQGGTGQAAVVNQDGTINGPSNPAPVGSTITLYGTGQGQVSPSVPEGTAAPGAPFAHTVAIPTSSGTTCLNNQPSMCVAIGTTGFGNVQFSGLAPGYVGLWQINVTIPPGTPPGGAVPVRVIINGTPSNTVTVAVR